jgi:hypothetical protein
MFPRVTFTTAAAGAFAASSAAALCPSPQPASAAEDIRKIKKTKIL